MDFESLKSQVSNLTLYDLKAGVRKVQNAVMNLTEMESKVREATNADPWGASATLMNEISQGTHNYQQLNEIMPMIYKRFTDKAAEEWRQIYKALQLLEFLIKNGSERVVDDARSHLSLIRMLRQFHFIDQNGKDQGVNVRNRSSELVKLLGDVDTIRQERKKARTNRNKYGGVEGGMGMGGFPSNNRYGGFGSETSGYGGYQGEVYGDGGGFGGRETDFSGTQRRADQFEEYDEEEEGEPRAPVRTSTSRSAASSSVKREQPKQKAPVQDLFDFGDEPEVSTAAGKAPATQNNVMDDFGTVQGASTTADDDFDDFQSATSPAVAQPSSNPLAALSPPPTVSTTTSATQFAAPQPVAPIQTSTILPMTSPPTSKTPSLITPSTTSISSPSAQAPPMQNYKPSGPNYYTSVSASINNQGSSASSVFTARPTMPTSSQPSYNSSTSAASLGKPTSKPVAATGGDAFGSLWSNASTKAGVQNKQPLSRGPDLASMAKAKSEAGIWGPSASSGVPFGTSNTPRPGAINPSPNTASGQAKPNAPLGNGLDDLLG